MDDLKKEIDLLNKRIERLHTYLGIVALLCAGLGIALLALGYAFYQLNEVVFNMRLEALL